MDVQGLRSGSVTASPYGCLCSVRQSYHDTLEQVWVSLAYYKVLRGAGGDLHVGTDRALLPQPFPLATPKAKLGTEIENKGWLKSGLHGHMSEATVTLVLNWENRRRSSCRREPPQPEQSPACAAPRSPAWPPAAAATSPQGVAHRGEKKRFGDES